VAHHHLLHFGARIGLGSVHRVCAHADRRCKPTSHRWHTRHHCNIASVRAWLLHELAHLPNKTFETDSGHRVHPVGQSESAVAGENELVSQLSGVCTVPGVLDLVSRSAALTQYGSGRVPELHQSAVPYDQQQLDVPGSFARVAHLRHFGSRPQLLLVLEYQRLHSAFVCALHHGQIQRHHVQCKL